MRNAAIAVLREIGVDTGGSNVQFAVNPAGWPARRHRDEPARVALLGAGLEGDRLSDRQDRRQARRRLHARRTRRTRSPASRPASFEPTIDYVVTKMPRFTFEKFPGAEPLLTTSMKSVGEAMAIGRSFAESVQKALRSMETGLNGFDEVADRRGRKRRQGSGQGRARQAVARPPAADRAGLSPRANHRRDPRRLPFRAVVPRTHRRRSSTTEERVRRDGLPYERSGLLRLKQMGFPTRGWAGSPGSTRRRSRPARRELDLHPVYKRVDTCAAEFPSLTPYLYSCYEGDGFDTPECEADPSERRQGGDPRRRTQPHRPGHRVRLLLCPCRLQPARSRHRDDHGQLQPGDRLDRLRHLRPAVFRAADRRGRDRDRAGRGAARRRARRHRAIRRPDAAQARRCAGARAHPDPRHLARRDRPGRGPPPLPGAAEPARPAPATRTAPLIPPKRPRRWHCASAIRW